MATPAQPNIVFLFSDQQRADTIGASNPALNITPHLDHLAHGGVRFTHALTPQPLCGPTRALLQAGRWPTQINCWKNHQMLPLGAATFPKLLRSAGYRVGYIGKWHLASHGEQGPAIAGQLPGDYARIAVPADRRGGWDDFWLASDALEHTSHSYDGHMYDAEGKPINWTQFRADALGDHAINWLRQQRGSSKPFCLMVSWLEPHHQNDHNRYEGPVGSAQRFADAWVPDDLRKAERTGDWRENWADYLGCVSSLDSNVGRIVATLANQGMLDNTLIIYTSDHGSHFRTREGEYKRSPHDASLRIPMIVRGPGFAAGQVRSDFVNLLDVPSTILHAAGLRQPAEWAGRPMQLPAKPREAQYVQISEASVARAVRTERYTYCVTAPDLHGGAVPGSSRYVESHLYDNLSDPHQLANRVSDPALASVRNDLRGVLLGELKAAGEAEPKIEAIPGTAKVQKGA